MDCDFSAFSTVMLLRSSKLGRGLDGEYGDVREDERGVERVEREKRQRDIESVSVAYV